MNRSLETRSARERILDAADELFLTSGIQSTGINMLIEHADVAKASFYSAFKSKNSLIDAYLERQHDNVLLRLQQIAQTDASVEAQLGMVFDLLAEVWTQAAYRGCLFVLAQAELPQEELPAVRWARIHKLSLLDVLRDILDSAGMVDSEELAEQISVVLDGTIVAATIRPDCDAFKRGHAMALTLIGMRVAAPVG